MLIVVIAAFLVVRVLPTAPLPAPWPWWVSAAAAAGYVLATWMLTALGAHRLRTRLLRNEPLGRGPAALAAAMQACLLAGLAALIVTGWGRMAPPSASLPLAAEWLALTPFAVAIVVYWRTMYPLQRTWREHVHGLAASTGEPVLPYWSRGRYVWFNFRHQFLFVAAPATLVLAVADLGERFRPMAPPWAMTTGGAALALAVLLLAPAAITMIWDTDSLPPGPLRQRLEQSCRRMGLSCRDILVWNTSGVVVNAGVLGVLRPVRYLLLSDALLERMDEPALEAIVAHEAGHVVYHHIFYMVLLTGGLLSLLVAAWGVLASALGLPAVWAEAVGTPAAVALWLWPFGFVSRRFERQADVYAAWVGGRGAPGASGTSNGDALTEEGVRRFQAALGAVGRLNGIDPARNNFRHGSIRRRLLYLEGLWRQGLGRRREEAGIARLKLLIWVVALAGLAALVAAETGTVLD